MNGDIPIDVTIVRYLAGGVAVVGGFISMKFFSMLDELRKDGKEAASDRRHLAGTLEHLRGQLDNGIRREIQSVANLLEQHTKGEEERVTRYATNVMRDELRNVLGAAYRGSGVLAEPSQPSHRTADTPQKRSAGQVRRSRRKAHKR